MLTKGTLVPVSRTASQGPVTIELTYGDKKATGTMNMGGQARPIEADLGGPLFADGAGMSSVIATLPLADGYAVSYRNFDVQKGKEKTMQLKVAARSTRGRSSSSRSVSRTR